MPRTLAEFAGQALRIEASLPAGRDLGALAQHARVRALDVHEQRSSWR